MGRSPRPVVACPVGRTEARMNPARSTSTKSAKPPWPKWAAAGRPATTNASRRPHLATLKSSRSQTTNPAGRRRRRHGSIASPKRCCSGRRSRLDACAIPIATEIIDAENRPSPTGESPRRRRQRTTRGGASPGGDAIGERPPTAQRIAERKSKPAHHDPRPARPPRPGRNFLPRHVTATTFASASEPLAWNTSSKTRPPTFTCAPPTRTTP